MKMLLMADEQARVLTNEIHNRLDQSYASRKFMTDEEVKQEQYVCATLDYILKKLAD